jgi:hypothetical protein
MVPELVLVARIQSFVGRLWSSNSQSTYPDVVEMLLLARCNMKTKTIANKVAQETKREREQRNTSVSSVTLRRHVEVHCTDTIGEPFRLHIMGVPNVRRKVRCGLVYVDVLDEFRVKMWIPERPVGHQLVIKMSRTVRVMLESMELRQLGLCIVSLVGCISAGPWYIPRTCSSTPGKLFGGGGIPQLETPGMDGGTSSARIWLSSS